MAAQEGREGEEGEERKKRLAKLLEMARLGEGFLRDENFKSIRLFANHFFFSNASRARLCHWQRLPDAVDGTHAEYRRRSLSAGAIGHDAVADNAVASGRAPMAVKVTPQGTPYARRHRVGQSAGTRPGVAPQRRLREAVGGGGVGQQQQSVLAIDAGAAVGAEETRPAAVPRHVVHEPEDGGQEHAAEEGEDRDQASAPQRHARAQPRQLRRRRGPEQGGAVVEGQVARQEGPRLEIERRRRVGQLADVALVPAPRQAGALVEEVAGLDAAVNVERWLVHHRLFVEEGGPRQFEREALHAEGVGVLPHEVGAHLTAVMQDVVTRGVGRAIALP